MARAPPASGSDSTLECFASKRVFVRFKLPELTETNYYVQIDPPVRLAAFRSDRAQLRDKGRDGDRPARLARRGAQNMARSTNPLRFTAGLERLSGDRRGSTMRRALITGSSGLIGSEAVATFDGLGWEV